MMKLYITSDFEQSVLQSILSKISAEALAQSIGLKIDFARISFVMDYIVADEFEQFNDCLLAYYIHLLQQLDRIKIPADFNVLNAEVFALLARAFSNKGGTKTAITEGRTGFYGGMRYILDKITDQFKQEEQEKIVNQVLKFSFDPLDWKIKVSLIKNFIALLPNLPCEISSQPPERFANHYELLVKSYVNSMDQLKYTFQTL